MPGKFEHKPFSEIDLSDSFFDSLKNDYPEFESTWFPKCIREGREALVFSDEYGLGAFVALKEESDPIPLAVGELPACSRLKISTLRLAERFRGQRLGEGALGLILWDWQKSKCEEIYVTVFPEHTDLISQITRFGFVLKGNNNRGEGIYLRSRRAINFSDPYKAFPFLSPHFRKGGYLLVEDHFHDTLFPYSELSNTIQEQLDMDVANGISKVYVGNQWQVHYQIGEPIFIYRKFNGVGTKRYKSCLTSYAVVTGVLAVKRNGRCQMSFEDFCSQISNKSIFPLEDLRQKYYNDRNVTIIQMLYCGYFGSGNNINMDWLDRNGLWSNQDQYPANIQLSPSQCSVIWSEGGINIDNIFGR